MCGITGYVANENLNGEAMTNALQHRGPDSTGSYQTTIGQKNIFFGHKRLKILDPSKNGDQPFKSLNEDHILNFNGEIYNYEQLADQYFRKEPFISKTDTEVILKLYNLFGISFLNQLNGDFAIAILDNDRKKVILARDRSGVKPLYYSIRNDTLVFGSELKSLLRSGINFEMNHDQIQTYFAFKYTPGDKTLFKDIFRLDKGSFLEYDIQTGTVVIRKYWEPSENEGLKNIEYNDARAYCFNTLKSSCEMRMMGDVPKGNFFSGGVDSSILAWFLKNDKELNHYCASKFNEDLEKEGTTSDFYYASKLAANLNFPLKETPIGSHQLTLEMIRKTLQFSDDLIADGAQIPAYLISKEASKDCKVIMSGMGADELFSGYAYHQLILLSKKLDKLPGLNHAATAIFKQLNPVKGPFKAYKRHLNKLAKYYDYPDYKYGIYGLVGDFENATSIFEGDKSHIIELLKKYFKEGEDPFLGMRDFELDNFLVKNLHYMDRMAMANSIECRVPFLDHRMIDFTYNLKRNYKISNMGKTKKILKDAFQPYLPAYILNRRKAGFNMPLRSIFMNEKKVNELLEIDFFSNFSGFNIEKIQTMLKNHINTKEDNSALIYALISFQEWYKIYVG